jgi:NYN domain
MPTKRKSRSLVAVAPNPVGASVDHAQDPSQDNLSIPSAVVDALDLCYTKEHIDTFVIISGDSDFSPLVSKLRENAKTVIGVGVKDSTSDLLISNCDEFIYYDDMVRDVPASRKGNRPARRVPTAKAPNPQQHRKQEAIDLVLETTTALASERGDTAKLWGSMIKQTLKRRHPGFNESFYGFPSFNQLLEEAQTRGYLKLELDEKSGGYIIQSVTP